MLRKSFLALGIICTLSTTSTFSHPSYNHATGTQAKKSSNKYVYKNDTMTITYVVFSDNTYVETIVETAENITHTNLGTWEMHHEYEDVIVFSPEEAFVSAFRFVNGDMVEIDEEFNFKLDENNEVTILKKMQN